MLRLAPLSGVTLRELRFFDLGEILGIERELFPDPWSLAQFKEELSFSPRSRYYVVAEDRSGEVPRILVICRNCFYWPWRTS